METDFSGVVARDAEQDERERCGASPEAAGSRQAAESPGGQEYLEGSVRWAESHAWKAKRSMYPRERFEVSRVKYFLGEEEEVRYLM